MPFLGIGTSLLEQEIEKATHETVIKEDVSVMFEICDRVNVTTDGQKEAYRCLVKRLQNPNPRVGLLTLSLFDVFVMNCGKRFHLEVCSREFITLCKNILLKGHPKVQDKLKFLLAKWVVNEFKSDPQLALIDNFIQKCKHEGIRFDVQEPTLDAMDTSSKPQARSNVHSQRQEEDDLAKAIELSLQETKKTEDGVGLYPSMQKIRTGGLTPPPQTNAVGPKRETKKVRALYDFEAAEENELSFKAGEVIIVLEDRDANWWKGSNHRGEGLFPSNFVSSDLEASPVEDTASSTVIETPQVQQVTQVDESKIDSLLLMLHDADPTALQRTEEDAKMEALETECNLMNPLIDTELEKIDRRHATLSNLSRRLNDALAMYHQLLRQPQMPFVPPSMGVPPQIPHGVPQMPYYPQGPMPTQMNAIPGYHPGMQMMPPGIPMPGQQQQQPPMMGAAPGPVPYQQEQQY